MNYRDGLHLLPPHMHDAVERYIEHGIPAGHFLMAVLRNDLMEAFGRADEENTAAMRNWCAFLHNYAPSRCFGSSKNVDAWIAHRGLSSHIAQAGLAR